MVTHTGARVWLLGNPRLGPELAKHLETAGLAVCYQSEPGPEGDAGAAAAALGGVDALVYLAGARDLDGQGGAAITRAVERESGRFLLAARETVRLLVRAGRPGSLVCVCDVAGLGGRAGRAATAATSAALMAVVKSLAKELGRQNIRVNALAVGPLIGQDDEEALTAAERELFAVMGLGRPTGSEQLAANLDHLLSASHGMTGQVLRMDDGLVI